MRRLGASIVKEILLLLSDKSGLVLMFIMPIILVFIITIVQDSTFKLVNENNIELIIVNKDKGSLGDSLIQLIKSSGGYKIIIKNELSKKEVSPALLNGSQLLALWIPINFSEITIKKANAISTEMLLEFEILEKSNSMPHTKSVIELHYDPLLQENFRVSILSSIHALLGVLENGLLIKELYRGMGFEKIPSRMEDLFFNNTTTIKQVSANLSSTKVIPNSTQHNAPAWSIFAMFFMVISLGGNIVNERLNGSFIRLQTIPSSFSFVIISKMISYLIVAFLQLTIILGLGKYTFPLLGLPSLTLPSNMIGLIVISVLSALAAISFALVVGTYAKTTEQANSFGAISIIILAAIGGIWVPSFVMPDYMQTLGTISPLHWCLEGYYTLFLKGGSWLLLRPTILYLALFIVTCQILTFIKLKKQNYI